MICQVQEEALEEGALEEVLEAEEVSEEALEWEAVLVVLTQAEDIEVPIIEDIEVSIEVEVTEDHDIQEDV